MVCSHLRKLNGRSEPVTPRAGGCEECLAAGTPWVHLRLCMTCGHVGCCDSSPNRHASRHWRETGHPVMKSYEPGEEWAWCYADEKMIQTFPSFPAETPSVHHAAPEQAP